LRSHFATTPTHHEEGGKKKTKDSKKLQNEHIYYNFTAKKAKCNL
jgi:hypothetical protein